METDPSPDLRLRSDFVLLDTKNNGGLFVPTMQLVSACKIIEAVIRELKTIGLQHMSKKIVLKRSMNQIVAAGTFDRVRAEDHDGAHPILNTHVLDLIRLICSEYIKIRLHFIAREETLKLAPVSVRNHLSKTIIFKGQ